MHTDKTLISRLEKLARLDLTEQEMERFSDDLSKIFGMVGRLQELDTDDIQPLAYPTEIQPTFREDKVTEQLSQSEALGNAPKQDGQYFLTPKVIDAD
ncbi:MAG: Asp-tRNA(Asn)/Glu-tRNA(Gln) amidotransferase subunit GatC [Bacteroidetes bacterium]|nr:MAG: Asp-tRNA(Asn)/Glu-tRNA(Gln) amidotransferase subunit GatC [Bacteroidota bacterium]